MSKPRVTTDEQETYFDYKGEPHAHCGGMAELIADIELWLASTRTGNGGRRISIAATKTSYTIMIEHHVPETSEVMQ